MADLISAGNQRKKLKFVFDETVFMKDGWAARGILPHINSPGWQDDAKCVAGGEC